jgi:hypothetical protein
LRHLRSRPGYAPSIETQLAPECPPRRENRPARWLVEDRGLLRRYPAHGLALPPQPLLASPPPGAVGS